MKFIITAQPGPDSQPPAPDAPFDEALFTAYMKFNEDLHQAGRAHRGRGHQPGVQDGARRGERRPAHGDGRPFHGIEGADRRFLHHRRGSLDEAIGWALKCPTGLGFDDVLEIRALTGEADLRRSWSNW